MGPGRRRRGGASAAAVRTGHVPVRGRGIHVRVQRVCRGCGGGVPVSDTRRRLDEPEPVQIHALHPSHRAPGQVQGVRDPLVPLL
jgi:hypothetical protein